MQNENTIDNSKSASSWRLSALINRRYASRSLLIHDVTLIGIMMVLAGCGMIYEFLLSHYAARVLGATEVAIFGVFTVMIASMGIGSFAAGRIKCAFTGFAWLELCIGMVGSTAILLIAGIITFTSILPSLIAATYNLPGITPNGGVINYLQTAAQGMPYFAAFVLGTMIGAEIPLIARVREQIYGMHLQNNTGTIYGADYIGAGIGALFFVGWLLTMETTTAAIVAASANIAAGLFFFFRYRSHIRWNKLLLTGHFFAIIVVLIMGINGAHWEITLEDMLYKDKVIYSMHTRYQRVVVTKRIMDPRKAPVYSLHINGHTQFSSFDEKIYHSMLVYPAMAASARHNSVLVVGGGDGLAVREILKWNPKRVVLLDLDKAIIDFFTYPFKRDGEVINAPLLKLNNWSFSDDCVDVRIGDAFLSVDKLLANQEIFDTIIVDLPDPNHPDLNKLYSSRFYAKLKYLLAGDGAISVQSTSPYHAPEAFMSIGKTMKHAGFTNVDQYHANVPSFGEWGWTIATPTGGSAKHRLDRLDKLPLDDGWMTREVMLGAFAFHKGFYDKAKDILVNRINSNVLYDYYRLGWDRENGVF